jgi:hypothetical protein
MTARERWPKWISSKHASGSLRVLTSQADPNRQVKVEKLINEFLPGGRWHSISLT